MGSIHRPRIKVRPNAVPAHHYSFKERFSQIKKQKYYKGQIRPRNSVIDLCDLCLAETRFYKKHLHYRLKGMKLVCMKCYSKLENKKGHLFQVLIPSNRKNNENFSSQSK